MGLSSSEQAKLAELLKKASKAELEGTKITPVKLSKQEIGRIEGMLALHGTVIVAREKGSMDRKRAARLYTKQAYLRLVDGVRARRAAKGRIVQPVAERGDAPLRHPQKDGSATQATPVAAVVGSHRLRRVTGPHRP